MDEILFILIITVLVLFWWDNAKSGELALHYCRQRCQKEGFQLLDASVSRQRIWLRKAPGGGVQLCRLYSFEYSDDRESRLFGYIVLIGKQIVESSCPGKQPGQTSQAS